VYGCTLPDDLKAAILQGYAELQHEYGNSLSLAVRSSATAEDSPQASFAGQNETYLNIAGEEALLDAYKRCLASNFTDRSIHYKFDNGFDYFKVDLAVVVMKMVRSDLGASGVMFSLDTETGFKDVVFINATWGLGRMWCRHRRPGQFLRAQTQLRRGVSRGAEAQPGQQGKEDGVYRHPQYRKHRPGIHGEYRHAQRGTDALLPL
jgi:hypothetical protein